MRWIKLSNFQADSVREENDYHNSMLGSEYIVGGENEMVGGYPDMQTRPLPRVAHIYQQNEWNQTVSDIVIGHALLKPVRFVILIYLMDKK